MKRSFLSNSLASAAAFGFGASAGQDFWRWVRKNVSQAFAIVVLFGAVVLPILAGKGFTQGHDRRLLATIFKTVLGNCLLLAVGVAMAWGCLLLFTYNETDPIGGVAAALLYAAMWATLLLTIGIVWGLALRPRRKRTFAIAAHNARFLRECGITETAAKDATHVGPGGERLRWLGNDEMNLVFLVVGQRGHRAYISMDNEGRFQTYSGPVRP
jgi:hypothetical protein